MPANNKSPRAKKQAPVSKLIKAAQSQQKKELVEQWRFLRKIGVYNTKEGAAQIRLTESRIREIKRRFKEVQKMKSYDYKGRVIRPIDTKVIQTKSGPKIKYDFTKRFTFVKTKNKTNVVEGVKKTKLGYIVEKPPNVARVRINKKGEIVEAIGEFTRKRNKMRGRELLKFIEDLESGKKKLKKNQYISMHRWGARSDAIEYDAIPFLSYMSNLEQEMRQELFDEFIDKTYIELLQYGDDE